MYATKTLPELAAEVRRQINTRRDFLSPVKELEAIWPGTEKSQLTLRINGHGHFPIRPVAHRQIAESLKIPKVYYDRMLAERPDLAARSINEWLPEIAESRLVRTIDDQARAFLSNSYRRLDNAELLAAAVPVLQEQPEMQIMGCEITESRVYIEARFPRLSGEVRLNDVVQAGILIRNSEVGDGSILVAPMTWRLRCTNGAIMAVEGMRRAHLGRRLEDEGYAHLLSNETLAQDDKALWMKVADVTRAALTEAVFSRNVERMRDSTERKIESATGAVAVLADRLSLSNSEAIMVLEKLMGDGDLTQYGVGNALTYVAQEAQSYDRAVELQGFGGQVFGMDKDAFLPIARAAPAALELVRAN